MMNQMCKVCGEPAAGFHFGAFTCEGCKSFFGRSHNNYASISECKNSGGCVINKKNRTSCKACRLKKCLMVGMSKSGSRYGRRSNWFKVHCVLQEQMKQDNENKMKYYFAAMHRRSSAELSPPLSNDDHSSSPGISSPDSIADSSDSKYLLREVPPFMPYLFPHPACLPYQGFIYGGRRYDDNFNITPELETFDRHLKSEEIPDSPIDLSLRKSEYSPSDSAAETEEEINVEELPSEDNDLRRIDPLDLSTSFNRQLPASPIANK